MSDAITRAQEVLGEHRDSIDRLDAILVYTLALGGFGRRRRFRPRICEEIPELHHRGSHQAS